MEFSTSLLYRETLYSSVNEGLQRIERDFAQAAERIKPGLADALKMHLQSIAQKLAQKNSIPWPGGTTDATISRRSGEAVRSLQEGVRVTPDNAGALGEMYGASYLMVHEYGATIRATQSQFLAIPLPEALNSDGTPKYMAPRQWADTFVGESKKGNLLIFQRRGRQIVPLYVLKKEVTIKARLGLRRAQEDGIDLLVEKVAALVTSEIMG